MPSKAIFYDGSGAGPARSLQLRAGPLAMFFEPDQVFLRHIRLDDREVLRGIYVAVRDRNWNTVTPRITDLLEEIGERSFRLSWQAECRQGAVAFTWQGQLTGDETGRVRYSMDGKASSTFLRNRIGFCVLHPIRECAGQRCLFKRVDGPPEEGVFPYYISPHQPFTDLRSIHHEVRTGVTARVFFEGDIFETEDQRNWTDASYKTYCTPLRLPFPVEVEKGDVVSQSVVLALSGVIGRSRPKQTKPPRIEFDADGFSPVPKLGLGMASHGQDLEPVEVNRLKQLKLDHLRLDLRLYEQGYPDLLRRAAAEARRLETSLQIALFLSERGWQELKQLMKKLPKVKPPVVSWLIFHRDQKCTDRQWIEAAKAELREFAHGIPVGGGTNAYFAELNRGHPAVDAQEFTSYSINPQVHTFDNLSLVETLEAQAYTLESALKMTNGRPVIVSPVTLKPRFNPNATGPAETPGPGELPEEVDPRQMSLFGAGWTLGSLKSLSEGGARSLTFYETTGWRGIMETSAGSPLQDRFASIPGAVFPLYHVLADFQEYQRGDIIRVVSSDPLKVEGLALRKGGRWALLVANLTREESQVELAIRAAGRPLQVRILDEDSIEAAVTSPESFRAFPGETVDTDGKKLSMVLKPYAYARLEWTE
jgi:D-apionolactonase